MRRPVAALVSIASLLAAGTVGGVATASSGPARTEAVLPVAAVTHSLDRLTQWTRTDVSLLRPDTVVVEDAALPAGQLALRRAGVSGRVTTTVRVTSYGGSVIRGEVVDDDVVQPIDTEGAVESMSGPPRGVRGRLAQSE
jgi:hypothetical protein